VNQDGTVSCWGANPFGQIGNGTTGAAFSPALVSGVINAVAVAAGGAHSCAVLVDGTARCWGANSSGQLGDNGVSGGHSLTPVVVSGLANAVAIVAGESHSCALLADGSVRCWGANGAGELGNGTTTNRLTPGPVTGITAAAAVVGGQGHSCVILVDGTARCWGSNSDGQLGDGTTSRRLTPVRVEDGSVEGLKDIVAMSGGGSHSCALLVDSTMRCWGDNEFGQLGTGTTSRSLTPVSPVTSTGTLTNVVGISASFFHTCALLADGSGRCWGRNASGRLGNGDVADQLTASTSVFRLANAVVIDAGAFHTCAVLADGTTRCWGSNASGQLGDGTGASSLTPVSAAGGGGTITARDIAAGRNHTCAVRANSTVACWGSNASGQLGDGGVSGSLSLIPVTVSGLTNVVAVAGGDAHTCALLGNGTAKCWGLNSSGQLGTGTTTSSSTPVTVSGLTNAIAIAAGGGLGNSHTCALLANGTARCWGSNSSGQLGDGTTTTRLSPVAVSGLTNAVSIAVGEFHTCALLANRFPFCWGFNSSGQLGNGTLNSQSVPIIAGLDNTVAIAGGNNHTCGLRADGTAWCWGNNLLGQLGIGTTVSRSVPDFVNLLNVVAIAGGFGHTCALVANGGARCWGDNSVGQLGNSTIPSSSLTPVTVGKLVGNLATFFSPLLGTVNITTGRRHSCTLQVNGGVACWGDNSAGQLGLGSTTNQSSPATVPSFTLNIDPSVVLEHNERVSTVTILATCEDGQRLQVEVVLVQGEVSGHGVGSGKCTGGLEGYPVTVPAQGRDGFIVGPGEVSAEAVIRERGQIVETQEWTRKVAISSAP